MSPRWLPPLYALAGLGILLAATTVSHGLFPATWPLRHAVGPALTGAILGFWLGLSRRKGMQKERALDEAGRELESRLEEIRRQGHRTRHLQGLVDHIPLPIFLKDEDYRYILVNTPFERMVGRSGEEIIGRTDQDVFPAAVADLFREQDEQVLRERKRRTFEETLPLAQGVLTFHSSRFPLHDESGAVYAVGGLSIDISLRKGALDEADRERRKLMAVVEAIDQGVLLARPDGHIELANGAAGGLLRGTAEPLVGRDLHALDLPASCRNIHLTDRFGQDMGQLVILGGRASPAAPEKKWPVRGEAASGMKMPDSGSPQGTILIMDDDHLVRRTSHMMLDHFGFTVVECSHGQAAVDAYRSMLAEGTPPRAVIMDLTVPDGMGGVEATEGILAMDPEARIMVASGSSRSSVMANYRDHGFLARVEKPFTSQKLKDALHRILDG